MTSQSDSAVLLAQNGFSVFPCEIGGKLPAIKDFPHKATMDAAQVKAWWNGKPSNVGISTSHYGADEALVVVDVDLKKGKRGDLSLLRLEMDGFELPTTFTVSTPSGGEHLYYRAPKALRQGVDVIGQGLDIRSLGGYVLGPGSLIDGKEYTISHKAPIAPAPEWLVQRLKGGRQRDSAQPAALPGVDEDRAAQRAKEWLERHAPLASEGEGGDTVTYKVAAKLKDFGCGTMQTLDLMDLWWNDRCLPPWGYEELAEKVEHAYKYGIDPVGVAAPEAIFQPVEEKPGELIGVHPFEKLNQEHAFIFAGGTGNILWETTDPEGGYAFHLMNKDSFLTKHAAQKMAVGDKTKPVAQMWLEWDKRRTYDGIVFEPGGNIEPRWYNLWRGFSVKPAESTVGHPMVDRWLEHLRDNVCGGDKLLADWLISWFAHLVQKPEEKPLVAVVLKGGKGVGKNALVDRIGKLMAEHYMVTARRRYLVSNFTQHLQKLLLFVLDEAFWSGDKETEGIVKDLVTGDRHIIEPKGKESYTVRNLTRVIVIGNEDWIVPASHDERRWAVFHVSDGRKQDRDYFEQMRIGLDQEGGGAHLLRFLLDYKITQDINQAPQTQALVEQKLASLDLVPQWWFDCLSSGAIAGGDWGGEWPKTTPTNRLREALRRWAMNRNIRSRLPEEISFGRTMKKIAPGLKRRRSSGKASETDTCYEYLNPGLVDLRHDWEVYIGGELIWE